MASVLTSSISGSEGLRWGMTGKSKAGRGMVSTSATDDDSTEDRRLRSFHQELMDLDPKVDDRL